MDLHIVKRNRGKIIGSSYHLGDFAGNMASAFDHLKENGYSDEEATDYLKSLPIQNESI